MESTIKDVLRITWPSLVIILSIVIILRLTYLFKGERRKISYHQEILQLLFLAYLVLLFQLVTSQDLPGGGRNLMPFREILRYEFGSALFYKQVFGNILLFVPLGYFATSYCKIKHLGTITLVSVLSSVTIEVVQSYIGRSFDIDDVILNVIGGILGYLIYIALDAIKNHLPGFLRKDWIYDILSIILLVLIVLYLIRIL